MEGILVRVRGLMLLQRGVRGVRIRAAEVAARAVAVTEEAGNRKRWVERMGPRVVGRGAVVGVAM